MKRELLRRLNEYPVGIEQSLQLVTRIKKYLESRNLRGRVMLNLDAWKISIHANGKLIIGFYMDFEAQAFIPQLDLQACLQFERENHLPLDVSGMTSTVLMLMCSEAHHQELSIHDPRFMSPAVYAAIAQREQNQLPH
jgi:hypothetical protein